MEPKNNVSMCHCLNQTSVCSTDALSMYNYTPERNEAASMFACEEWQQLIIIILFKSGILAHKTYIHTDLLPRQVLSTSQHVNVSDDILSVLI